MGVSIVADKGFDLFADNKYIGSGDWWEPAKDTYRFRVRKDTKVFAVKVRGGDDARMGLLGSFGKHLVTSVCGSAPLIITRVGSIQTLMMVNGRRQSKRGQTEFYRGVNGQV